MTDTSDKAIEALRSDVMSQVGDDVQKMFDHEALFKRAAAMLIALQAERNQLITTAEADARVKAAALAEREACAEILDEKAADHDADASRFRSGSDPHHNRSFLAKTAREHAAAIRARGVTG